MESYIDKNISFLSDIFYTNNVELNQILPIIKNVDKIKDLISFMKSNESNLNFIFEELSKLLSLFKSNIVLIPFFIESCKRNNLNLLYESIFDIYLNEEIKDDKELILEDLIKLLITNASLPKSVPEYLYQKMSHYFYKEYELELNEKLFMKYLQLLNLCYCSNIEETEEIEENIKSEGFEDLEERGEINKKDKIKNYMYFSGINSSLTLKINNNSTSGIDVFPSLENGLSFVFWINLDKQILIDYNTVYKLKKTPLEINLIKMNIAEHQIKFILKDSCYFQIILDKMQTNLININSIFTFGHWVNICFIISKKTLMNPSTIRVFINGASTKTYLLIPKEFPSKIRINKIAFFENLIGRVSSLFLFSFPLDQKLINYFSLNMNTGIYNNKILFKFLISNENNYFQNAINYKYYEKYKNEKNKEKLINILLKEQNIKNIISIFSPISYDKKNNSIDDIFGNYLGVLSKYDGVNNYVNHIKNIQIIGGISNLLPIAELMLKYKNTKSNIITEESVLKYFNILKNIIIGHSNNLYDANKNFFFSNLGLLLEKFPPYIYTENLLRIILDIGKEFFQHNDINNTHKSENYINNFLLNEKIISKFSTKNQIKLWEEVNKFFISDYSKIKESLNIKKICILLRFYDENRYNEHCCKRHANIIKLKTNEETNNINIKNIMNPEMNKKTEKLFEIIQLYINKLEENDEDTVNLYKLLLLDLSPCLQLKIIQVFINYFICKNIPNNKKEKTLTNLLKNNYFEITEYVLSISLLDVRIGILQLLKTVFQLYRYKINSFFEKSQKVQLTTIFYYIGANLFPDQLLVEINHDKKYKDDKDYNSHRSKYSIRLSILKRSLSPLEFKKKIHKFSDSFYQKSVVHKDRISLMKFINKDIYNEEKDDLWRLCSSWIIYETNSKNLEKNFKINNFAINFCTNFASKNDLKYISNFLIILIAFFNDDSIDNNIRLFSNYPLFLWLIETIFNYHNKTNIKNINNKEDEDYINTIQKKSLEALQYFLINKSNINPNYEQLVKFILDYSILIKTKVDEENINIIEKKKKKDEISRITCHLLLSCMESTSKKINFNTQICFRFLIYYKNSKSIINTNNNNKKFNINNNNDDNSDDEDSFEVVDNPIKSSSKELNFLDNNYNQINSVFGNINKDNLIPYYILEGINYDETKFDDNEDNYNSRMSQSLLINSSNNLKDKINLANLENKSRKKKKLKKNVLLKEIWQDYILYDYIIDYYYSNLWGLENLCKKVKIEYENNPIQLIKKLYNEYSNNKKYKNILLEPILDCFNIKDIKINDENNNDSNVHNKHFINIINNNIIKYNKKRNISNDNINILTINLILLSIAIDITNDKVQKEYLENQYQQLIIFCILASVNIKTNEKDYNLIQNELYNILGYGCLFLKTINEQKYQQIFNYLITPIFKEINGVGDNKRFKKMLGLSKKKIYSKTAVFTLFSIKETTQIELNKTLTLVNRPFKKRKSKRLRFNSFDLSSNENNNNKLNLNKENPNCSDNENAIINDIELDYNNDLVDNITNYEIKPEFQVNKEKRIEDIFNNILTQYKKFNNKNNVNIRKLLNNNDDLIAREKKRIFDEMKKLIPNYIEKLKKYSNTSYFIEKLKRNRYKKVKYKLFSWRGFWSNKYLFFTHPEYLKFKIKNHYTKEMIKPILTPILDINYYLPKFKLFEKKKLFNKDSYNYNIHLDIDDILKEDSKINSSIINIREFNSMKNVYGFNYLECLYKLQDQEIWEYYKLSFEEKKNANKYFYNFYKPTKNNLINNNNKRKNKYKDNITGHILECCIVKITNHIKGYIITRKNYFEFVYIEEEMKINENEENNNIYNNLISNSEDDLSYDKDMGCCFGSIFKIQKRDKEKIYFFINYENIKYFFIRNYYYRDTAIEIFTEQNKTYFFNFKTKDDLFLFISDIVDNNDSNIKFRQIAANIHDDKDKKKLLGYEKILPSMKNKTYFISNKVEEWQNYNISTLEYLMWLNIYSGRSFNDLNQYPVFPWILTNYSSDKVSEKDFRTLNLPIGMLEISDKSINRKEEFITFYETLKNEFQESFQDLDYQTFLNKGYEYLKNYKKKKLKMLKKDKNHFDNDDTFDIQYNQIPYNYGTHYSNPTYVSHYLSRIFPFSLVSIEIHGNKFDDPERMFFSIEKTFESVTSLKDDVRELIPEFYYLPDMFRNINNLNLAQDHFDSNGEKIIINDVVLPFWSKNNSIEFVLELRQYLENNLIHINKWIDLIFGSYQRGENAEKINNIFMSHTYEKMIKIMEINDYDQRCALLRLCETGITPRNLFKNDSKQRIEKSIFIQKTNNSGLNYLEESLILDRNFVKMKKYNLLNNFSENKCPKIIKIKIKNDDTLIIITNTNQYFNLNLKKDKKDKKEKKEKKEKKSYDKRKKIYLIENNSSIYAANYQISSIETPIIIYNNNKLMLKAGFWDGRIEINSLLFNTKNEFISSMIFSGNGQPIVCMEISKDEKLLFCGTKDGAIIIYEIDGNHLKIKDIIYSHSDEITSISINDNLNMFASTSFDGYIMLYLLPSFQLVRAIHISSLRIKKNENIIINKNNENDQNKKNNDNENIINTNINENKIIENKSNILNEIINNNNTQIENNIYCEESFEEYNENQNEYADNVFLSSSPLPCIVIYISSKNIFRSYTINGEFINEIDEKEKSSKILSPIIYKNLSFNEILIYGTNNGYIKIRAFPKMNLIHSIKIYKEDCEIRALEISNDKRYCYSWGKEDRLAFISDNIISDFQEI